MASSSTNVGDIEDRFFQCSLCLETLKDPKALPCLHRYCRKCMQMVIARKKGTFNCPLCNEECVIPPEGVDGFKTDFLIKSVLECLQLQNTFRMDNVRRCHGCEETKMVTSYCFKCRGFLCQQCSQFHLSNKMVQDHLPHLLNLQTMDVRSLTLEKLTSLTEDPRCAIHVKRLAEMCCETCGNIPTCVACCSFGKHKGHVAHEVKILVEREGVKLKKMMSALEKCRDNLYELPKRVAKVRQALESNIMEQLEKARSEHKKASERILKKAEEDKAMLEEQRKEIIKRKKEDFDQVHRELEEEMKKLKARYYEIMREKEQNYSKEEEKVATQTSVVDEESFVKVEELNEKLRSYEERVKASRVDNEKRITEVADHSTHTINRYENFTATAETVQASHDEWTEAQCLPAITAAGETLIDDAKKEFGDLESLSKTSVGDTLMLSGRVVITGSHESVVDIKGIGSGWEVQGITSGSDGHIVVTGWVPGGKSHITVINRDGGVVRQEHINKVAGSGYPPYRDCHSLSEHLTATVCASNQVGLYDNRSGKYVSKNIQDTNINWPGYATCVCTDRLNNIYVGGNGRDVLVFDDQLNYHRTIKLPGIINWARDIAVHGDHLIVCDWDGKRSYTVSMQEEEAEVIHQLPTPDSDWRPISVCTDSSQYIYMLWYRPGGRCILTQYSHDGRQLLTSRQVDKDARCITTIITDEGEKLLVGIKKSKKMYTFGLVAE